jgi:hypothetical protein
MVDILSKPSVPSGLTRLDGIDYLWPASQSAGLLSNDGAGVLSWVPATVAYTAIIGDGAASSFVLTHNLGTKNVIVALRDRATDRLVDADVVATSTTQVTVAFGSAVPTTNQYQVMVFAAGGSAPAAIYAATLDFSNGDTLKRFTITNPDVAATSKIVGTIRRPDTADDSADFGYLFIANVVKVATGSFDLLVAATDGGIGDVTEIPPLGTVEYDYQIA